MPTPRRAWAQPHFSQRGSYSIERMHAFNNYCKQTPLWRAVAVCLVFSLPALLTSIALELIPLQNPFDGVKANHGAWTRLFFIALIGTIALLVQINQLVPQLSLSTMRIMVSALATACCYMVMMITIASEWIYPIPFGLVIGIMPYATLVIVFFLLAVGLRRVQSSASLRRELKQQINIVVAQAVLAVIYPIFIAVYRQLHSTQRMFFVILLPVIKITMQQFVAWSAKDLEDYQPGIVVFCVEVFNALYGAKTMQSTNQSAELTIPVILAVDLFEFGLVMSSLHHKIVRAKQLHHRFMCTSNPRTSLSDQPLLDTAIAICEQKSVLSSSNALIRLHSSIRHLLSQQNQTTITQAVRKVITVSSLPGRAMSGSSFWKSQRTQIVPVIASDIQLSSTKSRSQRSPRIVDTVKASSHGSSRIPNVSSSNSQADKLSRREQQELVHLILKLLFECEYCLLVEYVECIVPMMYAIYVAIVQQLPSARYYPETQNLDANQAQTIVLNLLLYAGLETLSLLLLHAVIKKRCGFSPTHIMGFVLENQALEFQGRLFLWYIFLLEFTLVHFGVDLNLRFAWIRQEMLDFHPSGET